MTYNFKSFFNNISEFSSKEKLGENKDEFLLEATYINFERVRIISLVALILFSCLWIWDIIQFLDSKWDESIGYQIITFFHSFLLVFLCAAQIVYWKSQPENPDSVKPFHKNVINISLIIVLFCTVFLALGDVLTNGSIAAYLGMIFAYASIFILTNVFSLM